MPLAPGRNGIPIMTRHAICELSDLPMGGRVIATVGENISVGVFNIGGQVVAFRNECPHAGAPVCVGTLGPAVVSSGFGERHLEHDGCILKCPWHAWEFKLPEGVTLTQPPFRLRPFPVVVEDGRVFVEIRPAGTRPMVAGAQA
jgi:nitrite reductase/ring-hydroxylating ferredoxin subunit